MRLFKAVADPTRFRILKILGDGECCVCEIAETLGLSQPTVSRHLRILEDAGLVTSRRDGQRIDYALGVPAEGSKAGQVLGLVGAWLSDDPAIRDLRRRSREIQGKRGCAPSQESRN